MGKPMLEAQESPPFEKPSIEQVCSHNTKATLFNTNECFSVHIPIYLFSLSQLGGEQFCAVQIQPPAIQGASNHYGAGQNVSQPDQLLAAGNALPEAPEGSQ